MGRHRLIKLVLPAIAVLALAAGAWAYFTSSGSGSGSGGTNVTVQPVQISASISGKTPLFPTGAAAGDVVANITNPNSSSVHLASLSLATGQGTNGFSANAASCALSFASQSNGGAGWTVPASGQLSIDLTNSVSMGTTAASSCQGQTFNVYLTTP